MAERLSWSFLAALAALSLWSAGAHANGQILGVQGRVVSGSSVVEITTAEQCQVPALDLSRSNPPRLILDFPDCDGSLVEGSYRPAASDLDALVVVPFEGGGRVIMRAQSAFEYRVLRGPGRTVVVLGGGLLRRLPPAAAPPTAVTPPEVPPEPPGDGLAPPEHSLAMLDLAALDAIIAEAEAQEAGAVALAGYYQLETAYSYRSPGHWSKMRNLLEVSATGGVGANGQWRLGARGSYDAVYDVTDHYDSRVEDDQRLQFDIRESYLDWSLGDLDFRVGRQQIVWGEVVGLFFADVVSALDLRESVLPEFDYMRIPQWALRGEYFGPELHVETVWIPYMSYNDIGEAGWDFYPFQPDLPGGVAFRQDERPDDTFGHSAAGLRLSTLQGGWDGALFYYTSRDRDAAFSREIEFGPEPRVVFTPTHSRIHQFGATLAKDFGKTVLKAEAVYTVNRNFNLDTLDAGDGLAEQNVLSYIGSALFSYPRETQLNLQFFQNWLPDREPGVLLPELETGASVMLRTHALATNFESQIFWLKTFNQDSSLFRLRGTWRFAANWRAVAGWDVLGGDDVSAFGRFDDNDRAYAELRYSF